MNFKSSYIKLTLFYVLIVMVISVTFSILLYDVSSREIDRGLGHDNRIMQEVMPRLNNNFPEFEQLRLMQIKESNKRIRNNLVTVNLLILVLSTVVSYFLARRTLEPIEEMVEAQNRFTSDASHELRTPLTAMKAEIEVGLRDKHSSINDLKELLKSNLEEIGKLEALSGALLKLAKYKENIINEFADINLKEVVEKSLKNVAILAQEKELNIKSDLENLKIKGEKDSLNELFVILIENAIKYSPQKSSINISLIKENDKAVVKVKDQGVGISSEDQKRIFDRFYRVDQSRNKIKSNGYGLGLSIAKSIVDLHKGTIKVTSILGEGSEFAVRLDLMQDGG